MPVRESSANEAQPMLSVRGLKKVYKTDGGEVEAVRNLTFDLRPGELACLVGPSGSGKTTLLTLIGALRSVQEGSIKLWGSELAGLNPLQQVEMRRNIGFIFQAHNLLDSLSARQNVRMSIELTDAPRSDYDKIANAMLASVGLADRAGYKPRNLSGG